MRPGRRTCRLSYHRLYGMDGSNNIISLPLSLMLYISYPTEPASVIGLLTIRSPRQKTCAFQASNFPQRPDVWRHIRWSQADRRPFSLLADVAPYRPAQSLKRDVGVTLRAYGPVPKNLIGATNGHRQFMHLSPEGMRVRLLEGVS